jgi:hypothetical protein
MTVHTNTKKNVKVKRATGGLDAFPRRKGVMVCGVWIVKQILFYCLQLQTPN